MDLPPKVMDRPLPGPTVFTDASSTTSTAAAVWQSEDKWHCVKMTVHTLSVQQLEASALVLACGLFTKEHLNIVTDSMFVAKLCLVIARPGVATSTTEVMIEEALLSRESTVSVIHVNSHDPIKEFFQIGNYQADSAAKGLRIQNCNTVTPTVPSKLMVKGLWTLRDAWQLHDTLHMGAKAIAKRCGISITDVRHIVASCPHCQK
ncbi:POL1 protein, partial [Horornis vulcanius]|nr:POL1 protein [Horornis vulcanius]